MVPDLKKERMANIKKNSAFFQQDACMGKLSADARKPQELNAIVRAGMAEAARQKAYREARALLETPHILR
jgi:hypothetical protein|tara:strand:+ start:765 stop:977 length:213 start_codon:yes stop_codon:yes gene_type:complete